MQIDSMNNINYSIPFKLLAFDRFHFMIKAMETNFSSRTRCFIKINRMQILYHFPHHEDLCFNSNKCFYMNWHIVSKYLLICIKHVIRVNRNIPQILTTGFDKWTQGAHLIQMIFFLIIFIGILSLHLILLNYGLHCNGRRMGWR